MLFSYDKELFSKVKTDDRTLYPDGLMTMIDNDGGHHPAPLGFDLDVMYQQR
ncbi:hypothetical protein BN8_01777 [Fibrisoma limi BUZ 3]|uniref:Uncharacterized protein n=1 Tax=Fibrisoma limi BUZ 3 TaxID=1185876 RepID=I2GFT0_9BACT|nr:hypothetical protein BN8_01777 [Fibrisoma limi BUZ 3]